MSGLSCRVTLKGFVYLVHSLKEGESDLVERAFQGSRNKFDGFNKFSCSLILTVKGCAQNKLERIFIIVNLHTFIE